MASLVGRDNTVRSSFLYNSATGMVVLAYGSLADTPFQGIVAPEFVQLPLIKLIQTHSPGSSFDTGILHAARLPNTLELLAGKDAALEHSTLDFELNSHERILCNFRVRLPNFGDRDYLALAAKQ